MHDDLAYPDANNLIDDNSIQGYDTAIVLTGHSSSPCGYPSPCGDRNRILNNALIDNDYGIFAGGTDDVGEATYGHTIQGNTLIACHIGMFFGYPYDFSTGYNTIADNTILSPGSWLDIYIRSDNNDITGNRLSRLESEFSIRNDIINNTIDDSVGFYDSAINYFIGNTFTGCSVSFWAGSGNHVYHNDFVNVTLSGAAATMDDGYPSGGNYWSDYAFGDFDHGPGQNEPGADGIGDVGKGRDHYPFLEPDGWLRNHAPYVPSNPVPPDGDSDVGLNADLAWMSGDPDPADVIRYDVYFGTTTPPPLASQQQAEATYDPGPLGPKTAYFWQVTVSDDHGSSSIGPTWVFYTFPPGDVDTDGDIDYEDYLLFVAAFGHSRGEPGYNPAADLDHDGTVSLVDYQLWRQAYQDYVGGAKEALLRRPGRAKANEPSR